MAAQSYLHLRGRYIAETAHQHWLRDELALRTRSMASIDQILCICLSVFSPTRLRLPGIRPKMYAPYSGEK